MAYASLERQHIVKTLSIATIGVAGFVDAAQAWRRPSESAASPFHVDIGGGVRVNSPKTGGIIRVDVGYGLRDGDVQLSAGWVGAGRDGSEGRDGYVTVLLPATSPPCAAFSRVRACSSARP